MVADFKKKKNTLFRKILLIGGLILTLLVFISLVFADINVYNKRKKLDSQIENLKNKIQDIESENKNLKENISKTNDEKYIEKIAREELDLQKPGEKVFSFVKDSSQPQQNNQNQKNFFQQWLDWLKGLFTK